MLRIVAETDVRLETVLEHMRLENLHDFPACAAKFGKAKYEVPADDIVYDGAEAVCGFLDENKLAFPDFHFEPTRVSPSPTTEVVVVEGRFRGTHLGIWRGLPATGRKVDFPMCLVFEFEGDSMVNEIIYMDLSTPLQQLGVAFNPDSAEFKVQTALSHPITLGRAIFDNLRGRFRRKT
jgi:predicted ester cyclase